MPFQTLTPLQNTFHHGLILVQVTLGKGTDCPTVLQNWPRRVRAPESARNRKKASVKKKKPITQPNRPGLNFVFKVFTKKSRFIA